ncbi:MAG: HAD family hydrolase [Desulfovibrio sp.]|jgi:HAD superfamily hydrolase (TIGR01509 family)|nr:HAD family hydrolase [Desulfovibrio sp.]
MRTELFPNGLKGIIFDCDGVMIDSREANRAFYNQILAHFEMPPMTAKQATYAFMTTARQALEHILPPLLHDQIEHVTTAVISYRRDIAPLLRLQPGFREFIDYLHAHNIRMAIATNRVEKGMQTVLDIFALPNYFNPMITASNAKPKPSPEGVQRICAHWGVLPRDVAFIGDTEYDMAAARGAGVAFISFANTDLHADITATDFNSLQQTLASVLQQSARCQH